MQPGWYPDPTTGRGLRWWNGTRWTQAAVEADVPPAGRPPQDVPVLDVPRTPRMRDWPWLLAVLAAVLTGAFLWSRPATLVTTAKFVPPQGPLPTASGRPEPSRPVSPCPVGNQRLRALHPDSKDAVFGGGLTVPVAALKYATPKPSTQGLVESLEDVVTVQSSDAQDANLRSMTTLGNLPRYPGYDSTQAAATKILSCNLDPQGSPWAVSHTVISMGAATVAGCPATLGVADVATKPTKPGDPTSVRWYVAVVDDGRPRNFSVALVVTNSADPAVRDGAATILAAVAKA